MGIINQPSRILQVTHLVKWGYIHGLCSHGATATNDEETALDEHVLATWHCSSLTRVCSFAAPMLGSQALEDWGPQRSHEQDPRSIPCQTSEVRVRLLWMVLRASRGYWALIIQHPFFQNMICKWFYIPLPHLLLRYLLRGQVVTPAPASAWIRIVTSVPAHGQGWRWGAGLG